MEEEIIEIIQKELQKPLEYQNSYVNGVYYWKEKDMYLFNDKIISKEVFFNIRFTELCLVKHQGIKMIKYTL